jgi:FkbM family methyltransferase
MGERIDISRFLEKVDQFFDTAYPGFIHAQRGPGPEAGQTELRFPCGLTCVTKGNPQETELMYNEIFVSKDYTSGGITVDSGNTVIDIGANVGMFTMFLLRNFKGLSIHAIEPVPSTYELLKLNVERYGDLGKVKTHNVAIGAHPDTETEIVVYPNMTGNSTVFPEIKEPQREATSTMFSEEENEFLYNQFTLSIRMTTLSSLINANAIDRIDLLKIDAEGCEVDILNALEPQHWDLIHQIAIEVHDQEQNLPKVIKIIETNGMKAVPVDDTLDAFGVITITATR